MYSISRQVSIVDARHGKKPLSCVPWMGHYRMKVATCPSTTPQKKTVWVLTKYLIFTDWNKENSTNPTF